ncbi:MAG: hypothetical protein ACYDBH_21955 [Acidobacteriaceae bacterium]
MLLCLLCATAAHAQNVGISTATPDNSALLELRSTTQGLLPPRTSNTQMLAIVAPATGDLVYNTTYSTFYYYNGSAWTPLVGSGWSITGDAGTNASTNFLGTIDSVDLVQRTDNNPRMQVYARGGVALTNTTNTASALFFYEPSGSGTLYSSFQAGVQDSTLTYTLPPSDGTSGQALDDSLGKMGWKTFGTVGGGFGDTLWARGSASYELYSLGKGNGKQGKYSIVSTEYCSASGDADAVFGDSNSSSAKYGCISGGSNNTVAGQGGSTVRGGAWNQAGSQNTMIIGGLDNSTSGQNAVILGGDSNSVSGNNSVILNGADNTFSSQDNLLFGYNAHPTGTDQLIFYPPTTSGIRTGVQNTSPTEAMDVTGNVRLSLALKPSGLAGSVGQYLMSSGSASSPVWAAFSLPTTNNWNLAGNGGTNATINYIGTNDATDFVMRTSATERARILSSGFVGIGTTAPAHQLSVISPSTSDEVAAIFGNATGSTTAQSIGVWGRADNTSTTNTGTVAVLATGSGNTTAGSTNVAAQVSQGEFAMGRTTQAPSLGTEVEPAAAGTAYSQQGPSGVIELAMGTDLGAGPPTAGVYEDLGTLTINNRYITTSSIILANVIEKDNGSSDPDPREAVYRVDIESRSAGSCVIHIGMIPFASSIHPFHTNDYIRIGYIVINPGR